MATLFIADSVLTMLVHDDEYKNIEYSQIVYCCAAKWCKQWNDYWVITP